MEQAIFAYAGHDIYSKTAAYHSHSINELIYILRGECFIHFDNDVSPSFSNLSARREE